MFLGLLVGVEEVLMLFKVKIVFVGGVSGRVFVFMVDVILRMI